jgi:hypothetical protein
MESVAVYAKREHIGDLILSGLTGLEFNGDLKRAMERDGKLNSEAPRECDDEHAAWGYSPAYSTL